MNGASVSRSLVCGPNFLCPEITYAASLNESRDRAGDCAGWGGASNGMNSWIVTPAYSEPLRYSASYSRWGILSPLALCRSGTDRGVDQSRFVQGAVHVLSVALTREG